MNINQTSKENLKLGVEEQINLLHTCKYFLYRFEDENHDVLYVGKSKNLKQRFLNHQILKDYNDDIIYIYITPCHDETELSYKEIYYINYYKNEKTLNSQSVYNTFNTNPFFNDQWYEVDLSIILNENCYGQELNLNHYILIGEEMSGTFFGDHYVIGHLKRKNAILLPLIDLYPINITECHYKDKKIARHACSDLNNKNDEFLYMVYDTDKTKKPERYYHPNILNYSLGLYFTYHSILELLIYNNFFLYLVVNLGYEIDYQELRKQINKLFRNYPNDIKKDFFKHMKYDEKFTKKNQYKDINWFNYLPKIYKNCKET